MAARRPRHEEEEEHENHERWLVTYADMITLLMVLFIVLFAIGQTDLAKYAQLKKSLNNSFAGDKPSVVPGGGGVLDGAGVKPVADNVDISGQAEAALAEKKQKEEAQAAESSQLEQAREKISKALDAVGLSGSVRFRIEPRGLVVTVVADRVLFDSGSASLRPEGRDVLDGLKGPLLSLPNQVAVEGHTDDRPIAGTFASNWELSTARATSVLRYMIASAQALPPSRLSAAGYADQRPVAPNDTEAHRAGNRRVEIVVVSQFSDSKPKEG